MHLVCACVNIKINIQNFLDLDVPELDLNPEEKFHPYFTKDVFKITGKVSGITECYSRLVRSEIVGSWNICQCLICEVYTHGTNYVTGLATCSSALKEEPTDLKAYGREENICYSQVFEVCFPSHLDVPEDVLDHLPTGDIIDGNVIQKITKQANSFLEMAERKMKTDAPVEKQLQAIETLRRRVKCEERYLQLLILQSKTDNRQENLTQPSHLQFEPNPCSAESDRSSLYYPESQTSLEISTESKDETNVAAESDLSSFNIPLGSSEIQKEILGLHSSPLHEIRSKSLDYGMAHAVGIFEMDDVAPSAGATLNTSFSPESGSSDEEDSFEFSEEFYDRRSLTSRDLARSVPLDVPLWPRASDRHQKIIDAKTPKEPQEIAESMRELARSVRMTSEDVLGDLPKPKTQL